MLRIEFGDEAKKTTHNPKIRYGCSETPKFAWLLRNTNMCMAAQNPRMDAQECFDPLSV